MPFNPRTISLNLLALVMLSTAAPNWASAGLAQCAELFRPWPVRDEGNFAARVHDFRSQLLQAPGVSSLHVNGSEYAVVGVLGTSAHSTVYLARAPLGQTVQVKHTRLGPGSFDRSVTSINYELAATRYYQSLGMPVSNILEHEIVGASEAYIVKEYVEGVTGLELDKFMIHSFFRYDEVVSMRASGVAAVYRFKTAHEGFESWLARNGVELRVEGLTSGADLLEHFIEDGDVRLSNIIFDERTKQWTLFDP